MKKKLPDSRYTVSREYVGLEKPVHVARFCGDLLTLNCYSYGFTREGAIALARKHRAEFLRVITGRKPSAV